MGDGLLYLCVKGHTEAKGAMDSMGPFCFCVALYTYVGFLLPYWTLFLRDPPPPDMVGGGVQGGLCRLRVLVGLHDSQDCELS